MLLDITNFNTLSRTIVFYVLQTNAGTQTFSLEPTRHTTFFRLPERPLLSVAICFPSARQLDIAITLSLINGHLEGEFCRFSIPPQRQFSVSCILE
jgi:hypothetical protein